MLKRINGREDPTGARVTIGEASYPEPFRSGLEFSTPARGTWNVVHSGMLLPEAQQIYVCSAGCLRGVVLTAAEMNAMDRFSTISVEEQDFLNGSMEDLIIDGVTDILTRLPVKRRAVLLFTACMHRFIGTDVKVIFTELQQRFPDIDFCQCWMDPIMRKSGLAAEQTLRKSVYGLWRPLPLDPEFLNIIGNDFATDETSDLVQLIRSAGFRVRDIFDCKSYDDFLAMASSAANISYNTMAIPAGESLEQRLGQKHFYLSASFSYDEIRQSLNELAAYLQVPASDYKAEQARCDEALARARAVIGDTPLAIDYAAVFRPFSLARLLADHGFCIDRIYADVVSEDDKEDFLYLQRHFPAIHIYSVVHAKMRVLPRRTEQKMVAIGQKSAYAMGTPYFVNQVENGGHYGYDGIYRLAEALIEAFQEEKDTKTLVRRKGLGCESCI